MSEIEKTCDNCKHCLCLPSKDPCKTCLTRGFIEHKFDTMWESKEYEKDDNLVKVAKLIHENGIYGFGSGFVVLPIYSDTVFKTENDLKIDHIDKRVEDIQHNVLVYGNDAITKIIGIKDQLKEQNDILHNFDTRIDEIDEKLCNMNTKLDGLSPDADIYLKDIRHDLCDLDIKLDCIDSILKGIQKALNNLPTISDISRIEDRIINMGEIESKIDELDGLDIKQFTVDEGSTEKELEEAHEHLKKMTKSEPKFKVGDLVRLTSGTKIFEVVKVKEENYGGKTNYRYRLKSVDHGYFQYCPQSFLTRVAPPIFSKEDK